MTTTSRDKDVALVKACIVKVKDYQNTLMPRKIWKHHLQSP